MAFKRWTGGAVAVKQVSTITISGSWTTGDTVTVTVNGRSLVLTVGAATATTDVAAALAAAINAASKTDGVIGTESRNVGGQEIPEFTDFSAAASSSTVVLTSQDDEGQPFTATVSDTSAGTASIAATVTPTGPHHADNAANWSGNTLPANGDTVQFDDGNVDCLYGLSYFRTSTLSLHFIRTTDYTGEIGLPADNAAGYPEYRTRFWQLYDTTGAKDVSFIAGANNGSGGPTRLDGASQTVNSLTVLDAGPVDSSEPSVEYAGGTLESLVVRRGYVLIDPEQASMAGTTIQAISIGAKSMQDNDTLVFLGDSVIFDAGMTFNMASGQVIANSSLTNATPITVNQMGGTLEARGANLDTVNVKAGEFIWSGAGSFSGKTLSVYTEATLNLSTDQRAKTFGTLNAYGRSKLLMGTYTAATITPVGCSLDQIDVSYYADAA